MNKFTELVVEALTEGSSPEEQKAIYRFHKLYKFIEKTLRKWKFSHIVKVDVAERASWIAVFSTNVPTAHVHFACFDDYVSVRPSAQDEVVFELCSWDGEETRKRSATVTFCRHWWRTSGGHVLTRDNLFDIFAELYS